MPEADRATGQPVQPQPFGLITPGNIDLATRPIAFNPDGSFSTVRSISITGDNGRAILIPTVSPQGVILPNEKAVDLYHQSGQHLGIFQNEDNANAYAEQLHLAQAAQYGPLVDQLRQKFEASKRPVGQARAV